MSHVEHVWEEPLHAAFLRRLAAFSRLVLIDRRGLGMSDPVPRMPTLEERMDDVRAVMDAAGIERAALLGVSEGGPMCALFAASFPERTQLARAAQHLRALPARRGGAVGPQREGPRDFLATVVKAWGTGTSADVLAPGLAKDPAFRERFARLERMAASPGRARMLLEIAFATDVRAVLPSIRVPTLVVHRAGDSAISADGARDIAAHIPGRAGSSWCPARTTSCSWATPSRSWRRSSASSRARARRAPPTACSRRCSSAMSWVPRSAPRRSATPRGASCCCAMIAGCASRSSACAVAWSMPRATATSPAFDGPARAIQCAAALRDAARPLGLTLRQGVHTGECEAIGDKMAGLAVHIGARVAALAPPSEIWVTGTVRDLVVGSRLEFDERGRHALKGVPGEWTLLAARV